MAAICTLAALWLALPGAAQAGTITTVAGNGTAALAGDEGPATSASLNRPQGVIPAPPAKGGYYVADNFNHVVRWVDAGGQIHRFAGTGTRGYSGDGGLAVNAQLNFPRGLAVMGDGSVLIADTNNSRIRRVAPDGTISTFAGNGTVGPDGDNGLATDAQLCFAGDVAVEATGGVLIADACNNRIREVNSNGVIRTVAGTGASGYGGEGVDAKDAILQNPQGVAVVPGTDDYLIADTNNNRVRKVNAAGIINTVAGTGANGGRGDGGPATAAQLSQPQGIEAVDANTFLIPDTGNQRIRRVDFGEIHTIAGNGARGFSGDGGNALAARLADPYAATSMPDGTLLIADEANNRIRAVDSPVASPTWVVNTTGDSDDHACEPLSAGHDCSLRDAINAANGFPAPSRIEFSIGLGGHQQILVGSALPTITRQVTIDGTTQPGWAGAPVIEVTGTASGYRGLDVQAGSFLRGLVVNGFSSDGIRLGAGSSIVQNCYVGTTSTGLGAHGNGGAGIAVSSSGNTLGGPLITDWNVISGNTAGGIVMTGADGNTVSGNYVGVDANGLAPLGNGGAGILAQTAGNAIGPQNLISGNGGGILLSGAAAHDNTVAGNRIGTDAFATAAIANFDYGVRIGGGAHDNVLGGSTAADRNVISGNGAAGSSVQHGILVEGPRNTVRGNYIGVAGDGASRLANRGDGITLTTGDNTVGPGNVISGNGANGVQIVTAAAGNNRVFGNLIGTNAAGGAAVANGLDGVHIAGASGNTIGGTTPAERNVIAGNGRTDVAGFGEGIEIQAFGAPASGNAVAGNYIGVAADGSTGLGNEGDGVLVSSGQNTVGGTAGGSRNVISGNRLSGVRFDSNQNSVLGNFIGTSADGEVAVQNGAAGVAITGGSNAVGDGTPAGRNIISGNHNEGVWISGANATSNTVRGNRIGTDDDGNQALGNGSEGVSLVSAGSNTVGGGALGQGNLISANGDDGVLVINESSDSNFIGGNFIGTDQAGNSPLGNGVSGVVVVGGADDNVIGGAALTARNVISGNGRPDVGDTGVGVLVDSNGDDSHGNKVLGNFIGVKANGRQPLGNEGDGVRFADSGNWLGTGAAAEGNVVSGNGNNGVTLAADNNKVLGNTIGADPTGAFAMGNNAAGVAVNSNGNAIGDGTAGGRNVISGNLVDGVDLINANANAVVGNLIGTSADGERAIGNVARGLLVNPGDDNMIGGSGPGQGNVISGNGSFGVSLPNGGDERNRVIGNKIGTDDDGEQAIGNRFSGVIVQSTGAGNVIGGPAAGEGNVISSNGEAGVFIFSTTATVQGNYLGTDDDGNQALPNGEEGVLLQNAANTVVGGPGPGEGNIASGNTFMGVWVSGTSTGTKIQGNRLGVGSGGEDVGNKYGGVYVDATASSTTIGGTAPGEANQIAFNDRLGVGVTGAARTASVRGNSIYSNDGLGVDLGDNGVSANDDGDTDTGPNDFQNYPELTLATRVGGVTAVHGSLHSKPNETYTVDYYLSESCDPSGKGEGRSFAGSRQATTDANGNASVDEGLGAPLPAGQVITATATDSQGNTSEFGNCATITESPTVSVGDASVGEGGGSASVPVTLSGPSAATVTVDYSTAPGTASAGDDYTTTSGTVTFAPGDTSKTVSVPIADDTLEEHQERFEVRLSNPQNATITDDTGVVRIADNDPPLLSVNTTADTDDGACTAAPGNCSLREAINAANAQPGSKIEFEIGIGGAQTIAVASALPAVQQPVSIDARTQPGYVDKPLIELTSQPGVNAIGLDVEADTTIRGLAVNGFSVHGILLGRGQSVIEGNYVGVGLDGHTDKGNGDVGIVIGSNGNRIGGTTPAQRNVISGNGSRGIWLLGLNSQAASGNTISGNYIGTGATGTQAATDSGSGVVVTSPDNVIGPDNVISGNPGDGVFAVGGGALRTTVRGNRIGTNAAATAAVPNGGNGVTLAGGSAQNVVGGAAATDRNVISGNTGAGVALDGDSTNAVTGNYVGTSAAGTEPIGNASGVTITSSAHTVRGNVISGNRGDGLQALVGGDGNTVAGNLIGTDPTGTDGVGNGFSGVFISNDANNNVIGGTAAADRNFISGNGKPGDSVGGGGVVIDSPGADSSHGNRLLGNYIGLKSDGRQALGNESDGVRLNGTGNFVGGTGAGEGNVISGNGDTGVRLSAGSNTVLGNRIGTDAAGAAAVGNNTAGVGVTSADNTIGDGTTAGRNLLSGNKNEGVWMGGTGATRNSVRGNRIGTDVFGDHAVGNSTGILLAGAPGNTIGGTGAADGNLISGNVGEGLWIASGDASNNSVLGNRIGTDAFGTRAVGNGNRGVLLQGAGAGNRVGGPAAGEGNLISANGMAGVWVLGTDGATVRGNLVGTDASGNAAIGNGWGVYLTDADDVQIGGAQSGAGNVIAASRFQGVVAEASSKNSVTQGNRIGVGTAGAALGNGADGVFFAETGGGHRLGGTGAGEGNLIANNRLAGVGVAASPGVAMRGNAIHANGSVGIDIGSTGVTPNDNLDGDTGPNGLQNFPVLSGATTGDGTTTVRGSLNSHANESYTVDLYSDTACDGSGNGEGATYLGSVDVTTDANGDAPFATTVSASVPAGSVVTATATDSGGRTSEFSPCQTASGAPSASVGDVTVNEGAGTASVPVTLSGPSARTVTVDYATADGSATQDDDYTPASGTVTFAPGETTKNVTVPVLDDTTDEADESFHVALSNPSEGTLCDGTGDVTITDDDAAPDLSIADATVAEGTGGTTDMTFTVTLSAASEKTVSAKVNTADGSATAPNDYSARNVTVTFAPGDTTKDVTVPVVTDSADETDESFTASLADEANANVARRSATGTILDDDGQPAVSVGEVNVSEGDDTASVPVTLDAASGRPVTVDWATADGSARAGSDYAAATGTVTFAPGETTQHVSVPITDDTLDEPDESFAVNLSHPAEATVGDGAGGVTIADNDAAPSVSVADVTTPEGTGGSKDATFAVTLSAPSGKTVKVDAATADGTATAPADYGAGTTALTFAPGETTKDVNVALVTDDADEPDETFGLDLSGESNADVARRHAVATILDDDPTPLPPQQQPEQRDTTAPGLTLNGLLRRIDRADLLADGLSFGVTPDEAVSLDVTLVARPRMLREARSGDVVIARKKFALSSSKRTVKLKVLRKLRPKLWHRRSDLRLIILATDAAGNRSRVTKPVTVRP